MRRNLYRYIVITFTVFVVWLWVIPFVFSKTIPVICENLSYNTPYTVKIENPELRLNIIPVAGVKAKSISVKSKKTNDNLFITNFYLKLRILPLLSGRVHIDSLKSESVSLKADLDTKLRLNRNFIDTAKNAKIVCDAVDLKNIKLILNQKKTNQIAEYSAENIQYINNGRYLKIDIKSDININGAKSKEDVHIYLPKDNDVNKSIINVHILNLDIEHIADYLRNYLPKDLISAKGTIDADADKQHLSILLKGIEINKKDEANSIIFPENLSIVSGLNLTRKVIHIDNAEIKSQNINTVISGTISNYLDSPIPEYNLKIQLNKSRIEDFIKMLPPFKTEDIDSYKLKHYKFYGDIIGNFSVKGDSLEPSINGNIYVNNGILTKPIPNAAGASVKLDFRGKYLNFDVNVPAGNNERVNVKGGVELYNVKYSDMRVWSTQNVDLATAEEKVVPIHEILNFVIGPVSIMDIKGKGNIDINIKGNRKNPHVWGVLNFKNVTTKFVEIPDLILTGADAVLKFDDENAVFNLLKGFVNGKSINIDGTCTMAGKFNFDVKTNGQKLGDFYKAIKTSTMIDDIKNMIPEFNSVQGNANLKMKVYGAIKDINQVKFNENFFTKGTLDLLGCAFDLQGIVTHNAAGMVNFDNTNVQMNISSFIGHSPVNLGAVIKDKYADISVSIPKLNLKDIVPKGDKFSHEIADIFVKVNAKYSGRTDKIEYENADFDVQILDVAKANKLKLSKGNISYKKGNLKIKDLNGNFDNTKSSFFVNLQADNIFSKPMLNGSIKLNDFELFLINSFGKYIIIPQNIRDIIKSVEFKKGKINLNAKISNNNVKASTDIGGIEFVYTPLNIPVKVINGSIYVRKNYLGLNKINLMADDMPILIDGGIGNLYKKPEYNLYINSKPKQDFIDKYVNNNRIYPIKLKGDMVYQAKLKGAADDFNIETEAQMSKDSSFFYMGATVGDVENAIILNLNMDVIKQKYLKIKEFTYDKLIESQGKRLTRLNMLKASGGIELEPENLIFRDLSVKTSHPTDVRILNILFRKPNIKQGQFMSDLRFNGRLSDPHLVGSFHIVETNIPFFDTTMKNISFNFKDKTLDIYSKGEVLGNDIIFKGVLKNKLTVPYYIENAELYTKDIDLNYITNRLKTVQVNDITPLETFAAFDIKNTVIKHLKLTADRIRIRNITADNLEAHIAFNEKKVFNIEKVKFNAANGSIDGRFSYNLLNDNTWIHLNSKNIDANDISLALFDLKNQIYGSLTGNVKLSCNGKDFNRCMETLNGSVVFDVKDGRMPKLGSLEYLLKAGNLVKGGLTGLSLNNVVEILVPLKTGNFYEIYGKMSVKKGVTEDIEISTRGKDLNLFITGSYNFANSNAQMEVLGILSKKISTMLGPIGNVSLNTLFNIVPGIDLSKDSALLDKINKIPAIELNSKAFRKFIAEINGNINGDNYVKSFKWIN